VRAEPDLGAVASVVGDGMRLTVLLWSYHDVARGCEDRRVVELSVKGLPRPGAGAHWLETSVDERAGNS
jgi:hypothetical protein